MQRKKIRDIWNDLPNLEHTKKYTDEKTGLKIYEVCGKKFQETTPIVVVIECLQRYYESYGKRAILAANNERIDWKAVSHALRAAFQVKQLFETNDIKFPLAEASFLKAIKSGKIDYLGVISPMLDNLMDKIEILASESDLPEKVDRRYWDSWLVTTLEKNLFQTYLTEN